jgi:protein-S-isoprenylcysteine O-methyltransferase Ste14
LLRGRKPRYPEFAHDGLFAHCRQPIYLGFALTLWTGPTWTPDKLLLALVWSAYCAIGPLHKEARYADRFGPAFAEYRRAVPYMLPRRKRVA